MNAAEYVEVGLEIFEGADGADVAAPVSRASVLLKALGASLVMGVVLGAGGVAQSFALQWYLTP